MVILYERNRFTNAYNRHCWLPKNPNCYNSCSVELFSMPNIPTICFKVYLMGLSCFSKFYRRHYELVSKFNVGLKTLLHQGLSEPEFYGDLVYKFKKIVGRVDFCDQFRKIIVRYKRIGYNINIMRQSACLVFNPITVNNFASLFNCTPVGRASDSMMAPT